MRRRSAQGPLRSPNLLGCRQSLKTDAGPDAFPYSTRSRRRARVPAPAKAALRQLFARVRLYILPIRSLKGAISSPADACGAWSRSGSTRWRRTGTFQAVTYGRLKLIQRKSHAAPRTTRGRRDTYQVRAQLSDVAVADRPDYNSILALASRSRSRFTPTEDRVRRKAANAKAGQGVVRPGSASRGAPP